MQNLLELDGEIFVLENGYWAKIEAQQVTADAKRPNGVKYSLTLHAEDGSRLIGYDNAHAFMQSGFKGKGPTRTQAFDHRHKGNRSFPYKWQSAEQLLIDFWEDVYAELKKGTKK